MSETETHIGKARIIQPKENQSLESLAQELCGIHKYKKPPYLDTYTQVLRETGYDKFIVTNDSILEILEDQPHDHECDILQASQNPDGTINFILQFYNGGCSFSEAMELALKKMKASPEPEKPREPPTLEDKINYLKSKLKPLSEETINKMTSENQKDYHFMVRMYSSLLDVLEGRVKIHE